MAKKAVKKKAAPVQSTVKPAEAKPAKKEAAPALSTVKPAEAKPAKKEAAPALSTVKPAEAKPAKKEAAPVQSTVKPVEAKVAKKESASAKSATVRTEAKVEVYLQFGDKEVRVDEIMKAAQDDFHGKETEATIQSVQLYLKPEDCAAYYVANGAFSGKVAM